MRENFDTSTPFGKAMIGVLSVFAQLERETILERTRIGLKKELRQDFGEVEVKYLFLIDTTEIQAH